MNHAIAIRIPESMREELQEISEEQNKSKSDLVRESLRNTSRFSVSGSGAIWSCLLQNFESIPIITPRDSKIHHLFF